MRIVMTLLARDEADICDAQIAFHLNAGVDYVVATDNGSVDGTTEILRNYERRGVLHLISNPDRSFSQMDVVTHMARLAATEFRADWVINSDADEFWWPRGDSLRDIFQHVPPRFGSIRGMWRHFVPRPGDEDIFAERMTVRLCAPTAGEGAFNPHFKTAHRADPHVRVGGGNHEVSGAGALPVRGWYPIDILHFSVRSPEQCERRYLRWYDLQIRAGYPPSPQPAAAHAAHRAGRMREFYDRLVVDDEAVRAGLRTGTYARDTRLRDALRSLRAFHHGRAGRFAIPPDRAPLDLAGAGIDEAYVRELALLAEGDEVVRAQRRVAELEARLARLTASPWARTRDVVSFLSGRLARVSSTVDRESASM